MSKLTINAFVSLDGVMQSLGAPQEDPSGGFQLGGWMVPYAGADGSRYVVEFFGAAGAFLLGRRSTGVVVNTYRPSGKPKFGSFALDA